ncbi:SusC/RagA family TonB-linked outer membrane protein [Sphingobacterium sp. 1.A.5]|uniref:SusC/RagA family TonB-linked outer membrane protein n=1 Tax=Sphingobacterium sp. 1.A.5 TaxID=2044604 RepID=UPI000C0BFB53|nr:SusC/RagA family TonB-linked outer membrane protein [Sphingobacterium sp. 1.A.5]
MEILTKTIISLKNSSLGIWIFILLIVFLQPSHVIGQGNSNRIKVEGLVIDKNTKKPIIGAGVSLLGSNSATTVTDQQGRFTIESPGNGILKISFLGYGSQNIPVNNRSELEILLEESTTEMDEVVVTALGITRQSKSLSYAQQSVDVESMTEARGSNLMEMLSGKAAGMQVVSGGGPLASTRVVIRGNNSLTGNNQPLYVIDGVPVMNGSGENGDLDFGNPVNSINPDEIENIEILKGANASALYGSDAANGVVLITTRKARQKQGLGITYGFNNMIGHLYNYPTYQNIYGAGQSNRFKREGMNYFGNSGNGLSFDPELPYGIWNPNMGNQDQRSWGLPMLGFDVVGRNGQIKSYVPQPGTIEEMYQTSNAMTNSLSVDKLTDQLALRFSYTFTDSDDILEKFNIYKRHNFNLNNNTKLTNWLNIDANLRYTLEDVTNRGFRSASNRNPIYVITNLPRDASQSELVPWKQEDGKPFNFRGFSNPYWLLNETSNADSKNLFAGNLTMNLRLSKKFNMRIRGATDVQQSDGWDFTNLYSPFQIDGSYFKWKRMAVNNNFEGLLSYSSKIQNDISVNANLGASLQHIDGDRMTSKVNMLMYKDQKTLTNSRIPVSSLEFPERKEKQAIYGMTSWGYKDYAFLELTARNEWSSTLPVNNNSYFYYSIGSSLVISDMFESLKGRTLGFWKLRGSFAQVGNDTGFDRLRTGYYRPENGSFLGLPYFVGEDVLKNGGLKPEKTQSWELGTEFRLWDNRIIADFTYYNKRTTDQIVEADALLASGYRREILNAGEIKNWGTEVSLSITPVKSNLVTWTSTFNWSKNNSRVVSLLDGVNRYEMGSGDNIKLYAEVGKPYGVFYGNDYRRGPEGEIYVATDGKPSMDPDKYLGTVLPDWFGGWINNLKIGKFELGTMIDFQKGGRVWSHTAFRGGIDGNTIQSLEGRWEHILADLILGENGEERKGFLQPGHTVMPGANYNENSVLYPDWERPKGVHLGNSVYDPSLVGEYWAGKESIAWVSPMDHWTHNNQSSAARYIYDASYIKIREVSLGFNLPNDWLTKTPFRNAKISAVGRNIAILFQNTPKGLDPQATSTSGNAQGFERGFSLPMATYGVDFKFSF